MAKVSVPLSTLTRLPGPESEPESVAANLAVSKVAPPPLAPSVVGALVENRLLA